MLSGDVLRPRSHPCSFHEGSGVDVAMDISRFIGSHISELLAVNPFADWPFEKSVEDDLDERRIDYVFHENGMSVICGAKPSTSSVAMASNCGRIFSSSFGEKAGFTSFLRRE